MKRFELFPNSALATGLLLVGSACTSTPSDPTLRYGISSPPEVGLTQPLTKKAAAPARKPSSDAAKSGSESAAPSGNDLDHPSYGADADLRLRSYALSQEDAAGGQSAEEVGKKLADPLSDVWALFTEFDYIKNGGKLTGGGDSKTVGVQAIFQPIMPIPLTENWKLITRPTVPIIFTSPVPKPSGGGVDFDRESGLGDSSLPLLLAPNKGMEVGSGSLTLGAGPTFVFPTATDDDLGTDTWEVGPAAVGVYKTKMSTSVLLGQYWWSYSETDSDAKSTSHGSLLYAYFYELGNGWQIGTNPTITYNDKATSGNKWNIPIGLVVAKTAKFGKRIIKFQLGMEYSIENQDGYGKEVLLKLNIIPVIASPFSK